MCLRCLKVENNVWWDPEEKNLPNDNKQSVTMLNCLATDTDRAEVPKAEELSRIAAACAFEFFLPRPSYSRYESKNSVATGIFIEKTMGNIIGNFGISSLLSEVIKFKKIINLSISCSWIFGTKI